MANTIETFCNGKVVVIKNDLAKTVPLFCSLCTFPMISSDDCISHRRIGVCSKCSDRWERDRSVNLAEGVLPDKTSEEWQEYIGIRQATSVRTIHIRWLFRLMLVQDYTKFLNLSKVLNTTFGSTGPNPARTGTQVIKFSQLSDGLMKVIFITTVNFASDTRMREARVRWEKDALSMIEAALKQAASQYKEQFKEEIKLSIVEETFNDSFEMISYSQYNPMHRALYRVGVMVDVE